jgi:hypothetical protein
VKELHSKQKNSIESEKIPPEAEEFHLIERFHRQWKNFIQSRIVSFEVERFHHKWKNFIRSRIIAPKVENFHLIERFHRKWKNFI